VEWEIRIRSKFGGSVTAFAYGSKEECERRAAQATREQVEVVFLGPREKLPA
jgi:hypothetical protein